MRVRLPNGREVAVELKNTDNVGDTLNRMMKRPASMGDEVADELEAGQLMTDLVKYMQGGNAGRQLWFSPAAGETAEQITERIINLVDKNKDQIAKDYFGLDNLRNELQGEKWHMLVKGLMKGLNGASLDGQPYVRVLPL